jgi:hypothetical protein
MTHLQFLPLIEQAKQPSSINSIRVVKVRLNIKSFR